MIKVSVLSRIILIGLLYNSLFAQNNLQYYLNSAYKNNPAIKESANNIRIKQLDKSLAESEHSLPQVNLTANYLFVPYFNNDKLITSNPQTDAIGYDPSLSNGGLYSAQINVSKNLFNSGVVDAYNNQADVLIKSNKESIELAKHTLQKDVTDQYLNCWQAQELYLLAKSTVDTLKMQLEMTEILVHKGLVKQSDYLLLKVEFGNQMLVSDLALNTLKSSIYQLNTLAGIKDTSIVQFEIVSLNTSENTASSKFYNQYINDSLAVLSQQSVFETKYAPQLNLFFNAGLNAVEFNDISKRFGVSAGFNFTLPLYDGSQKSISRQQSMISLNTVSSNRENQDIVIKNKLKESSDLIDLYKKSNESISSQLSDYTNILILSRAELSRGQLSMIDYITIIKNYLNLKKNWISSNTALLQAINQFNYWNW
jgi:outer membrane protein TolC